MIISDSREFIFFHVPKTGGTSVDFGLARYFDCAEQMEKKLQDLGCCLTPFWPGAEGRFYSNITCEARGWKDLSTDCLPPEYLLQADPDMRWKIPRYFVFAIVRNPYERNYSRYLMWQRYGQLPAHVDTFTKFLVHTRKKRNQLAYLPDLRHINFIGRTETLARDFKTVCAMLDLGEVTLPEVHVAVPISRTFKYLERYTPEAIQLVNDAHADEFRLFDYPVFSPDEYLHHKNDLLDFPPLTRFG